MQTTRIALRSAYLRQQQSNTVQWCHRIPLGGCGSWPIKNFPSPIRVTVQNLVTVESNSMSKIEHICGYYKSIHNVLHTKTKSSDNFCVVEDNYATHSQQILVEGHFNTQHTWQNSYWHRCQIMQCTLTVKGCMCSSVWWKLWAPCIKFGHVTFLTPSSDL